MHAFCHCHRVVEFSNAGNVNELRILPFVVTLAGNIFAPGSFIYRLRTGHSLCAGANAVWHTGINTMRIYNPVKQSQDQDPDGVFLRKWVPEIAHLPTHLIHTPWAAPDKGQYPDPIIDEHRARKIAADRLNSLRKTATHKLIAGEVVRKHASRAAPPRRHRGSGKTAASTQIELNL